MRLEQPHESELRESPGQLKGRDSDFAEKCVDGKTKNEVKIIGGNFAD